MKSIENRQTKEKERTEFENMLKSLTHASHEEWRDGRKTGSGTEEDPLRMSPRFKPAKLRMDAGWLIRNRRAFKKNGWIRNEGFKPEVDIAALTFSELPPSAQEESLASATYALEAVVRASKDGAPLNERFIEATADTIHEKWIVRNVQGMKEEMDNLREKKDPKSMEKLAALEKKVAALSVPYAKLGKDEMGNDEKEKDRKFVLLAIEAFKKQQAANASLAHGESAPWATSDVSGHRGH